MKTTLSGFIFLFFMIISSYAQPSSGTIFVGGDLGLNFGVTKNKIDNTTTIDQKNTNYSVLPQAGFFMSDIIAVGVRVGFEGYVTNYEDNAFTDKRSSNSFVFNPFARYYLINQKAGLFAQSDLGVSFGKTKTTNTNNSTTESNNTNIYFRLRPGVYYYISDRMVIQAFFGWVGYQSNRVKPNEDSKTINNSFGLNLNSNSLGFGLAYEF